MPRFVNRTAALLALAALAVGASAGLVPTAGLADGPGIAPARCDPEPWSYGRVIERSRPDGAYRFGPQRFCAEVVDESRVPLGPIGIVIDPHRDRAPPPPVPPVLLRSPPAPPLSWR